MIGIINYRCGNIQNLQNALDSLGHPSTLLDQPEQMAGVDKLILPGVGAFGHAAQNLHEFGFGSPLHQAVERGTPVLGICVGMQLLFSDSNEAGQHPGLGLIPGKVRRFEHQLKVPHMGWNQVQISQIDPLLDGIGPNNWFYFVHSYACHPDDPEQQLGSTLYGDEFCAVARRGQLWGVQFHPEKSQEDGMRLLDNFVRAC